MSNHEATTLVSMQYQVAAIHHELTMATRCLKRGKPAKILDRLRAARAMARESIDHIDEALSDATPYDVRTSA